MNKAIAIFLVMLAAAPSLAVMPMVRAQPHGVMTRGGGAPPAAVVVSSGLAHWWKANEVSGTTIEDYGSDYPSGWPDKDGTGSGQFAWITRTKEDATTVSCASMSINGVITISGNDNSMILGDRDFTIDWWMKNNRAANAYPLNQDGDWNWTIYADNVMTTGVGGYNEFVSQITGLRDGLWHHYAYRRVHSPSLVVTMYVDGVKIIANTPKVCTFPSTGNATFGNYNGGGNNGIVGGMGSIKWYNRALSDDECVQNHDAEK